MSATVVIEYLDELMGRIQPEAKLPLALLLSARVTQLTGEILNLPDKAAEDKNLSIEEASARLGVSVRYLYQHAKDLPYTVKVGSRLLFSSHGIAAWLKSHRGKG